jgi:copper homeostasis protein
LAEAIKLEISVETAERAAAAERGGADRIELCSELEVGGLTPSRELMQAVRASVKIPVFVMIRPRAGDFVYSATEFATMRGSIGDAKNAKMNGVVLGILTTTGAVDAARTKELVEVARPLPVTFHRAFDEAGDQVAALEEVIRTGATRILTSGGKPSAVEGAETIAAMVERARGRTRILAGARITARNVAEIVRRTGVGEVHAGLSSVIGHSTATREFEGAVRELAEALRSVALDQ